MKKFVMGAIRTTFGGVSRVPPLRLASITAMPDHMGPARLPTSNMLGSLGPGTDRRKKALRLMPEGFGGVITIRLPG